LLVVAFAKALLKLLVNDGFHAGVDFNFSVFLVYHLNAFLDVDVDTFVNESFSVRVLVADIKSVSRLKSKS